MKLTPLKEKLLNCSNVFVVPVFYLAVNNCSFGITCIFCIDLKMDPTPDSEITAKYRFFVPHYFN